MKALVTGGTGFVGRHLVDRMDEPVVAGRNAEKIKQRLGGIEARVWDPARKIDPLLFAGIDTVFHLAGDSIFKGRWNAAKKERIRKSRVDTTCRLVDAMSAVSKRPKTLICASAIGYYGSRGAEKLTEEATPGNDFLSDVCRAWEKEAMRARELGVRVVCIRIGVVLGKDGGAIKEMLIPFKMGIGGKFGSGDQYMSWIHIDDLVGIMLHAAEHEEVSGPVNAVSPAPLTNSEFTKELANALHRPAFIPVPGFALQIIIGEFATVLLGSQRVFPQKISKAGYKFNFSDISTALDNLLSL